MGLPSITSLANKSLGQSLLGRLLGASARDDSATATPEEALPKLKFKLGEEPHIPRTGSPGFQHGHWVIARPKLATPTIYQHARSCSRDHSSLGLGATTPPTTAKGGLHARSRRRESTARHSDAEWTGGDINSWQEDRPRAQGGYTGRIEAWAEDDGSQHGEQENHCQDEGEPKYQEENPENRQHGQHPRQDHKVDRNRDGPSIVDSPALDEIRPFVDDLYYAIARPRFDTNPTYLQRQMENASAAAGALYNIVGMLDGQTNRPPRPTDYAGHDRVEILEWGARLLIRGLNEDFPSPMRPRAAAALSKMLAFQDVRLRVTDATPSVVTPLVGLLQHPETTSANKRGREMEPKSQEGEPGHRQQKDTKKKDQRLSRGRGGADGKKDGARKEACQLSRNVRQKRLWCQGPLHAAACLRVLTLSDGLPEVMASASAIPALVDGLKLGSPLMKSVCGGCLASMAPCDEECCLEMIDFGVLPPVLDLIRERNPLLELNAWSMLAATMRVREARRSFVDAGGFEHLERMLARKRSRKGSNRFLLSCQESAMQVLLKLCEEQELDREEDEDSHQSDGGGDGSGGGGVGGKSLTSSPMDSSILKLDGNDSDKGNKNRPNHRKRDVRGKRKGRGFSGGGEGEGGSETKSPSFHVPAGRGDHRGNEDKSSPSQGVVSAREFVSKEAVFRAVMRQMKGGTPVSMKTGCEVLKLTWSACSRKQVDLTMPLVLDMLASDTWMLKSAAAQVILHVYLEDDQRLMCAASGGVQLLVDTLRTKAPQMQAGTLSALLSLCEHPDVPTVVAAAGGLEALAEYLTTTRDITTRYVVLTIMKIVLVCERQAVEPYLPDMLVTEHVLGASDEIDDFVQAFVEKRKSPDNLRVGAANVCRFAPSDIAGYKATFKELDRDASGALNERELEPLLKSLKVGSRKKTVKNLIVSVDKNERGVIEFDEFLDMMWDIKHAKGRARDLNLSQAGVPLEGTPAATQEALRNMKRQQQVNASNTASREIEKRASSARPGQGASLDSHASGSTDRSAATEEEQLQEGHHKRPREAHERAAVPMIVTTTSTAGSWVKEAALSFLPKMTFKKVTLRGFR